MSRNNGVRSKPLKSSTQDYTNLLFSDSESDDKVPDLKLPPIKGKKQRRKKMLGTRPEESVCTLWMAAKTLVMVVAFATVVMLTVFSFWSLQRIQDLQNQVEQLQNKEPQTPEVITLQAQIATINNTVTHLKKGPGSLSEMSANMQSIKTQLNRLENSIKQLNGSVASSKTFLQLPNNLKVLENSVAAMGSEIKENLRKNDEHFTALEKRISTVEGKMQDYSTTEPEASSDTVDKQYGEMLMEEITHLNHTLLAQNENHKTDQDAINARISTLEKYVQEHSKDAGDVNLDKQAFETLVTKLLHEKLANTSGNASSAGLIAQLSTQINEVVKSLNETKLTQMNELRLFKERTTSNFQDVNTTLMILNNEFASVAHHLDSLDQVVANLTTAMHLISKKLGSSSPSPASTATDQGDANIHIPGIETKEDLHNAFSRGWELQNGQVNITVINKDLSDKVNEDAFKEFDTDHNGLYSEEEMANALGLNA